MIFRQIIPVRPQRYAERPVTMVAHVKIVVNCLILLTVIASGTQHIIAIQQIHPSVEHVIKVHVRDVVQLTATGYKATVIPATRITRSRMRYVAAIAIRESVRLVWTCSVPDIQQAILVRIIT